MRRVIVILFILVASVWAVSEISQHPGHVLFFYRQWAVDISLWLLIFIIIAAFLVFYLLMRVMHFLRHISGYIRVWSQNRRSSKAIDKTHRGLLEMKEERWTNAERHLLRGIDRSKNAVINYLYAAEAAFAQKAFDRSEEYLCKAYQAAPQDEMAIGLEQARLQLERGRMEQALAILIRLREKSPYHPAMLKLLENIYIRLSDWMNLLNLLPFLRKAKVITLQQGNFFEKNIYCEMLDGAEKKNESIHAIRELWGTLNKKIRLHPDVLERYAKLLREDKVSAEEMEPLIRKVLQKKWIDALGRTYGLLATSDPARQLSIAESWEKRYGKNASLLLTLGRLCSRCQLWGKARHYLEEGLEYEASGEMHFELAKLFEQLGETSLALQYYKEGLEGICAHIV